MEGGWLQEKQRKRVWTSQNQQWEGSSLTGGPLKKGSGQQKGISPAAPGKRWNKKEEV